MTANAAGKKLSILKKKYLFLKKTLKISYMTNGKKIFSHIEKFIKNLLFQINNKGTVNSYNPTEHYIERILKPYLLKIQIKKSLFL